MTYRTLLEDKDGNLRLGAIRFRGPNYARTIGEMSDDFFIGVLEEPTETEEYDGRPIGQTTVFMEVDEDGEQVGD